MDSTNIATVAIVGGNVAGWMTAAFLSHMLGNRVAVTLIDVGADNHAIFNETSIPPLKAFHQSLGLNEADVIAQCQGSMKLGTQFVNWGTLGNRYFHPHGAYGAEFDVVPLHQWWLKAQSGEPETPSLDELSMAWALSQEARFAIPVPDRRLIQSTYDYAYHFDAGLYARYLATFAKTHGVSDISSQILTISRNRESGHVTQVALENGQTIVADFFIDCSDSGVLISQLDLGAGFIDWTTYLPCNRCVATSCVKGVEFTPYTRATARDAGWQWRIPLQHRTSMGYVFASDLLSDDDAINALMDNLDGPSLEDPKTVSFVNGRRAHAFDQNVVAIGGAAGFMEPLEATSIHLVYSGLTRLLALWPTTTFDPVIAREYNELTKAEWDLARDLLILHYKATTRTDAPLWRLSKEMAIPDSLERRLDHWRAAGRLISPRPELFQSASWLSVLVGQALMPDAWDPLADARQDRVDYQGRLAGIKRIIQETACQMPLHRDWIDKNARRVTL